MKIGALYYREALLIEAYPSIIFSSLKKCHFRSYECHISLSLAILLVISLFKTHCSSGENKIVSNCRSNSSDLYSFLHALFLLSEWLLYDNYTVLQKYALHDCVLLSGFGFPVAPIASVVYYAFLFAVFYCDIPFF